MSLTRIFERIKVALSGWVRPQMVTGFMRHDGIQLLRTRVSNFTRIESPGRLDIDDNVFIGHYNFIDASGGLTIGEGCQITNYVSVLTHSSHIAIRLYGASYLDSHDHIGYLKKSSVIGAYSFIGPHSVIMPGTSLGKGSLVSAYTYIGGGVFPDFAILAGNPAQVVGDTRELDAKWLAQHPELKPYYETWANAD